MTARPDGITVSCMGNTELPEWGPVEGQLWRHDIKNDAAIRHTKLHDGPVTYPAISSDGQRVAFVKNAQVVVISTNCGSESVLAPGTYLLRTNIGPTTSFQLINIY